jgi:outer membrane protein OmpA-like peptidoglycan-associated protein
MVSQENLLGLSQHFFTPDIVAKISEIVGQTTEKTKQGLKKIVPEFIGGLVNKGSTPEGAATIVDLINTHNFERNLLPDENKLIEGDEVIHNIFGKNLEPTLSRLSAETKIDPNSLSKMLGVVAPVCMGIIGAKIKRESLSMSGFMSFIKDQRQILAGYSPLTSEYYSLSGRNPSIDYAKLKKQPMWRNWIWAFLLAGTLFTWWEAVQYRTTATGAPVANIAYAPVNGLGAFLANPGPAPLPKHFYFEGVNFQPHSTVLTGGQNELNYVAAQLKARPTARGQILSISENAGTSKEIINLATRRAEFIRSELVARGVKPEQLGISGIPGPANTNIQKVELIIDRI